MVFSPRPPLPIRIDKGAWTDPARGGRVVPYKIYRPEIIEADSYPLVVWSHGLGGTCDGAGFLGRYVAGQGYFHVHIQHDGTDDALWRGMPGHPWDNIRKAKISWETVRNRYLDVHFALDSLEAMYDGRLDFERVGMCGHSFGALTTQIMAGQPAGREVFEDLSDPRIAAGILYSPIPVFSHQTGSAVLYREIKKPLLHMTGTVDESPIEDFGYEKRLEVFEGAGSGVQHAFVLDGGDHMVFNGSRGQLESYPDIDKHQDMIAYVSHVWWAAMLNRDGAAHDWLHGAGVQAWLDDQGGGVYRQR